MSAENSCETNIVIILKSEVTAKEAEATAQSFVFKTGIYGHALLPSAPGDRSMLKFDCNCYFYGGKFHRTCLAEALEEEGLSGPAQDVRPNCMKFRMSQQNVPSVDSAAEKP